MCDGKCPRSLQDSILPVSLRPFHRFYLGMQISVQVRKSGLFFLVQQPCAAAWNKTPF